MEIQFVEIQFVEIQFVESWFVERRFVETELGYRERSFDDLVRFGLDRGGPGGLAPLVRVWRT